MTTTTTITRPDWKPAEHHTEDGAVARRDFDSDEITIYVYRVDGGFVWHVYPAMPGEARGSDKFPTLDAAMADADAAMADAA